MKKRPSNLRSVLISLIVCLTALVEVCIVPGVWGKIGALFALALGTLSFLTRRFGTAPMRRAMGAILLGCCIGTITFLAGTLMMGMGFGTAISPKWIRTAVITAGTLPQILGALIMSQYPAPRFIRYSFTFSLFLPPISATILILLNNP